MDRVPVESQGRSPAAVIFCQFHGRSTEQVRSPELKPTSSNLLVTRHPIYSLSLSFPVCKLRIKIMAPLFQNGPGSSSLSNNQFPLWLVFSPVSPCLRSSPQPPGGRGSLIALLLCPSRGCDSCGPTGLLFLFHLPRQLCLLASPGPVSQPHL